jgi:hypothetical protein
MSLASRSPTPLFSYFIPKMRLWALLSTCGTIAPARTDKEDRFRLDGVFPGTKFTIGVRGRKTFDEEKKAERQPLKAGATLDLGDIRMKVSKE